MPISAKLREQYQSAAKRRGPRLPELGSVTPLPSFALALAPPQVKQASREYEQAIGKLSEARSAVSTARQDVQDATWRDREAARKAAKAGRKPKPATAPAARAAVTEAKRGVPAAEWEAREKLAAYVDAICVHARELGEAAREPPPDGERRDQGSCRPARELAASAAGAGHLPCRASEADWRSAPAILGQGTAKPGAGRDQAARGAASEWFAVSTVRFRVSFSRLDLTHQGRPPGRP